MLGERIVTSDPTLFTDKPRKVHVTEKVRIIENEIRPVQIPLAHLPIYLDAGQASGFTVTKYAQSGEPFVRFVWVDRPIETEGLPYRSLVDDVVKEDSVGILVGKSSSSQSFFSFDEEVIQKMKKAGINVEQESDLRPIFQLLFGYDFQSFYRLIVESGRFSWIGVVDRDDHESFAIDIFLLPAAGVFPDYIEMESTVDEINIKNEKDYSEEDVSLPDIYNLRIYKYKPSWFNSQLASEDMHRIVDEMFETGYALFPEVVLDQNLLSGQPEE